MLRFLLLLFASMAIGLVVALSAAIRRPMARVVRAMMLSLAMLLALSGAMIGIMGFGSGSLFATGFGAALVLMAARLAWTLRQRKAQAERDGATVRVPSTRLARDPHWHPFESFLDWAGRQQARRARTAIHGFLAERESESLTHDHRALLLSCEKRIPELLDACADRCRNASGRERQRYLDETLDKLVAIGASAERARKEVREADDRRLQVLHRYFEDVAGGDDSSSPR